MFISSTEGEFGPLYMKIVHKPFSPWTKLIKQDLESYTDKPSHPIDAFKPKNLAFDLNWKDIMVNLSQTLTDP